MLFWTENAETISGFHYLLLFDAARTTFFQSWLLLELRPEFRFEACKQQAQL